VGRRPTAAVVVLHGTISREHAELFQGDGGWQVRDLGSRNGTWVDGLRVQGRAPLASVSQLRFGEVGFFFFGRRIDAAVPVRSLETAHAAGAASFRFLVSGEAVELLLLGSLATEEAINSGGVVLHRNRGAEDWAEVSLPPLEFHLLRVLCDQAASEAASPSRSRGCVPTKQLAKLLPFQSRYANEENVRQVVRRVRKTLGEIGADAAVEALPGRGYFLAWPVNKE